MKRQDSGKSTLKTSENISRKKLLIFKVSAVLLALIFIILLEVFLRLIGYGSDFPLFTEPENKPGYIYMNPEVSNKYFFGTNNATAGYRELFKAEKDSATKRIFVLGASTGIGYPYLKNGSFHRWLQYAMNETFPEDKIEIINLSLTAINSYTLRDFGKELGNYNPDATADNGTCAEEDCLGECDGSAIIDDCGICGGENASMDCEGVCDGSAIEDECGICIGGQTGNTACSPDCGLGCRSGTRAEKYQQAKGKVPRIQADGPSSSVQTQPWIQRRSRPSNAACFESIRCWYRFRGRHGCV